MRGQPLMAVRFKSFGVARPPHFFGCVSLCCECHPLSPTHVRPWPPNLTNNPMITFFNHLHALHEGKLEMFRGELVPCFEVPARADHVLKELERRQLGPVQAPLAFEDAALTRIHAPRYLDFLAHAWDEWVALDPANAGRDAFPSVWPTRTLRSDVLPANFSARMGLFSSDAGAP